MRESVPADLGKHPLYCPVVRLEEEGNDGPRYPATQARRRAAERQEGTRD